MHMWRHAALVHMWPYAPLVNWAPMSPRLRSPGPLGLVPLHAAAPPLHLHAALWMRGVRGQGQGPEMEAVGWMRGVQGQGQGGGSGLQ